MPYLGPNFSNKIDDAFREDPRNEYAQNYLGELLKNWRDTESRLRRTALLAFVAAMLGEFLIHGRVAQIDVAGLTVTGIPIFQKIIPVVAAYLIYDFCNLIVVTSVYFSLCRELVSRLWPGARYSGLSEGLAPPVSLFFGENSWVNFYGENLSTVTVLFLGLIRPFIVIGAPLAYITQEFMHLDAIHQNDSLFWICIGLTCLLIMTSLIIVFSWLRDGMG
jgi:hypothetical protein